MNNRLIAVGMIAAMGCVAMAVDRAPVRPATGRFIITLKPHTEAAAVAIQHGLTGKHAYNQVFNGWAGEIPLTKLEELAADPGVASVVPDSAVSVFTEDGNQGSMSDEIVPAGVQRVGASPGSTVYTGAGVGVAVLDTGVDLRHTDLLCSSNAFSAYGAMAQDDNGHGTHVAGIIAGVGMPNGVVGVAPRAVLYSVKVLDAHGQGYDSDIIAGLDWIRLNATRCNPPIRVINLSLGRPASNHDGPLHAAIESVVEDGITVVVAAGNDPFRSVRETVPAGFPEVIAVASTAAAEGTGAPGYGEIAADTASFFTSEGAMDSTGAGVAISAPGEEREDIRSDLVSSVGIVSTCLGGGTARMSGTSMAAPHVAGAVALLYQKAEQLGFNLVPVDAKLAVMNGDRIGVAPLDSRTTAGYSLNFFFDGDREGILNVPSALSYLDSLVAQAIADSKPKTRRIHLAN